MKRKKINSIEDYVNSTKKKEDKYDKYGFLYYDPIELEGLPGIFIYKEMIPKIEACAQAARQAVFDAQFDPNRVFPDQKPVIIDPTTGQIAAITHPEGAIPGDQPKRVANPTT
jgi:hypothetical protein